VSEGNRHAGHLKNREQLFRQLFAEHYRDVLRYAIRRIGRDDAEDSTAMVFATAWRRIDELPDDDAALLWLYGVARRVLANQLRGQRRRQRLLARLISQPREVNVASNRRDDATALVVLDALSRLKPADQEVLRLTAWEGLSHAEIGRVLGVLEGTVAVRLHRARRRMERHLRSTGFGHYGSVGSLGEGKNA
jgi:RNA polymerase sigma-70 factor (ECF subfamily)